MQSLQLLQAAKRLVGNPLVFLFSGENFGTTRSSKIDKQRGTKMKAKESIVMEFLILYINSVKVCD